MTYKTILVHCDAGKAVKHRLTVAAGLAERFDARLVGLFARPPFEAPVYFDAGSVFPMDDFFRAHEDAVKAEEAVAAEAFKAATKGKPIVTEWRAVDGYSDAVTTVQARYADLVVVGQAEAEQTATPSDLPEKVALATGRPVLVVPYIGAARPPGKVVMLCWNASREAARAASDALPLLRAADRVVVLMVDPDGEAADRAEPATEAAAWLARHGLKVAVQREVAADIDVGSLILSRAADLDADLIVMGVYGHSRIRELVMGGASRALLAGMTVPILMSH